MKTKVIFNSFDEYFKYCYPRKYAEQKREKLIKEIGIGAVMAKESLEKAIREMEKNYE